MMKAITFEKFGAAENLMITTVKALSPKDDDLLVKVYATSVTSADWRIRSLKLPKGFGLMGRLVFGPFKPKNKILGTELAGIVEVVGEKVTKFKVGDKVIAQMGAKLGGYTEYKCFKENDVITKMPNELSFEEAATLSFGATTALSYLAEKTQVYPANAVLINGASGSVGAAAVQIAKLFGAEVTAVCSEKHFDFVRSLGADHVIDYKKNNFYENAKKYDVIMDITGDIGYFKVQKSLNTNARLLLVAADLFQMLEAAFANYILGKKVLIGPVNESSCRLVAVDASAILTADVLITANGVTGTAKLNTRVALKEFKVRTNLQSSGGIDLRGNGGQLTLDTINTVVQAKMLIGAEEVALNFETPYWVSSKNSQESFCQIKEYNE